LGRDFALGWLPILGLRHWAAASARDVRTLIPDTAEGSD